MFVHPLLALALVGGVASSTKTRATTAPKKDAPNVVLLFADDLGFGDPGFAGHPSNLTPNLDALRASGRRLSTWYSGCPVCTGSRASLMTGRVYSRVGVPGVFGPTSQSGLPLREVTLADQFRTAGYATGMLGKWHLGQREAYLPASRGFDSYLGIPFSDDMGAARLSDCGNGTAIPATVTGDWSRAAYAAHGYTQALRFEDEASDRGGRFLPLVSQSEGATTVVEQPVDLTHLQEKYAAFATDFIGSAKKKFFFYAALSHVHTTQGNLPDKQYAGCAFRGASIRGPFGDALAEADDLVGSIVGAVDGAGLRERTLFVFSSDNGPWMVQAESAGSVGHLYARSAGYWNVGKGSTWEGGIREPAFVSWKGVVEENSQSAAAVSSTDVFPTLSELIGAPLPTTLTYNGSSEPAIYDGVDQSSVWFDGAGTSARDATDDCLFFFGGPYGADAPSAARCGPYKLHYATGPGLAGCDGCEKKYYDPPMVFQVEVDPSEQFPLTTNGTHHYADAAINDVLAMAAKSLKAYSATYAAGELTPANGGVAPDADAEVVNGTALYGVCCDRQAADTCDCDGKPYPGR